MSAQNDLIPGVDLSALASVAKADLLQMVAGAIPVGDGSSVGIGNVIVMSSGSLPGVVPVTWPDVTNNPRFARFIWIDIFDPNNPVLRLWTGSYSNVGVPTVVAADWKFIAIPDNSVTTAKLVDGDVTIAKLGATSGGGADANKILVMNGAGTGVTVTTQLNILSTPGIIPLASLVTTGAVLGYLLQYTNAGLAYVSASTLFGLMTAGSISLDKLVAAPLNGYIIKSVAGNHVWTLYDPAADINAGTSKLNLAKINTVGANNGDLMYYDTPSLSWIPKTLAYQFTQSYKTAIADLIAWPADGAGAATVTFAHLLTTVPFTYGIFLYCNGGDAATGHLNAQQLPQSVLPNQYSGSCYADATNVYWNHQSMQAAYRNILKLDGSALANMTIASWKVGAWAIAK